MKSILRIPGARAGVQPLLIRHQTLGSGAGYADKLAGSSPTTTGSSRCSLILFKGWSPTETQLHCPPRRYDTGAEPRGRGRVLNRDCHRLLHSQR